VRSLRGVSGQWLVRVRGADAQRAGLVRSRAFTPPVLAIVALSLILLGRLTPAAADETWPACPASTHYDFLGGAWTPTSNDITGFRAPIVLRIDSALCNSGNPAGATSVWVAVQSRDLNGGIVQIGWSHIQGVGYCRFWEYNNDHGYETHAQTYSCAGSDGDEVLFKVSQWYSSQEDRYFWGMYDCGTADWSSCTLKSGGPTTTDVGDVFATPSSEVNYGGTGCTIEMMGSKNYRVRFGEGNDPMKGQKSFTSWTVRSIDYSVDLSDCNVDYLSDEMTDSTFRTYDLRN
jgi:hypothetical protein